MMSIHMLPRVYKGFREDATDAKVSNIDVLLCEDFFHFLILGYIILRAYMGEEYIM